MNPLSGNRLLQRPFIILLLGFGLLCCSDEQTPRESSGNDNAYQTSLLNDKKDFILITVDTLRADRLPFYGASRDTGGNPNAPWSFSWMADNGTIFDQVYCQVGITLPSLSSMWTGKHPLVHGALTNHSQLEEPTLAMKLNEHGWIGVGAVANGILRRGSGLERGFRDYLAFSAKKENEIPNFVVSKAQDLVREQKPLFVWAHFMAPHQPYEPFPPFASQFTKQIGPEGNNKTLYDLHLNPEKLTPEIKHHLRGLYDAEILSVESHVRQLLAGLDAEYRNAGRGGLLENAIVIFTSDHGEELGDRNGFFMHAKSLYSGVIQVPTIILGANWPAKRDSRLIGLNEVLPYIIEGAPLSESFVVSSLKEKFYSIRNERWTLIHNPRADNSGPGGPPVGSIYPYPTVALFDRISDPLEKNDLANQYPNTVRLLLDQLRNWHDELPIREESASSGIDTQLVNSLGYAAQEESSTNSLPPPWHGNEWPK